MGGYSFPSFTTLGSQVHLSPAGIASMTPGTWRPQPNQLLLSVVSMLLAKERYVWEWGEMGIGVYILQVEQVALRHIFFFIRVRRRVCSLVVMLWRGICTVLYGPLDLG